VLNCFSRKAYTDVMVNHAAAPEEGRSAKPSRHQREPIFMKNPPSVPTLLRKRRAKAGIIAQIALTHRL
jgi:hypothetical protein